MVQWTFYTNHVACWMWSITWNVDGVGGVNMVTPPPLFNLMCLHYQPMTSHSIIVIENFFRVIVSVRGKQSIAWFLSVLLWLWIFSSSQKSSHPVLFHFYFFQQRFADNFEAEQVGILEMAYMTEERLQSLGIPLGPRLRIMEEVKKLSWHQP